MCGGGRGARTVECYHPCVLIDAHTHIFPADTLERRAELCRRDATFCELYADPRAKLAVASELSAALDRNGTSFAIALGFAWSDPALWAGFIFLGDYERMPGGVEAKESGGMDTPRTTSSGMAIIS